MKNTVNRFPIKVLILILLTSNTVVLAVSTENNDYSMINITAGQVGVADGVMGPQRYGLEYRFKSFAGPSGFRLIPAIGAATSLNGANFIYSDIRHDFYLNSRWILIPSLGAGSFSDSKTISLGNELEFRTGIELAYQFDNKYRLGIALFHLSNGGISNTNPGTEALVLSICIPVLEL